MAAATPALPRFRNQLTVNPVMAPTRPSAPPPLGAGRRVVSQKGKSTFSFPAVVRHAAPGSETDAVLRAKTQSKAPLQPRKPLVVNQAAAALPEKMIHRRVVSHKGKSSITPRVATSRSPVAPLRKFTNLPQLDAAKSLRAQRALQMMHPQGAGAGAGAGAVSVESAAPAVSLPVGPAQNEQLDRSNWQLAPMPAPQALEVRDKLLPAERVARLVEKNPTLRFLTLANCGLDAAAAAPLEKLKNLETLDISHNNISADAIEDIVRELPRLSSLTLSGYKVNDAFFYRMALICSVKLRVLNIADCTGITAQSLGIALGKLKSLGSLDLSGLFLSEDVMDELSELESLQHLKLHHVKGLTDRMRCQLRSLGTLTVEYESEDEKENFRGAGGDIASELAHLQV